VLHCASFVIPANAALQDSFVIPANAGIHVHASKWIPALAGDDEHVVRCSERSGGALEPLEQFRERYPHVDIEHRDVPRDFVAYHPPWPRRP
jgi:hypothetical protein